MHLASHIRVRADRDSLHPTFRWHLNGAACKQKPLGLGAAHSEATDGDAAKAGGSNADPSDEETVGASADAYPHATDANALEVTADPGAEATQKEAEGVAACAYPEAADHDSLYVASGTDSKAAESDSTYVAATSHAQATNRESRHVVARAHAKATDGKSHYIPTGTHAQAANRQPADISSGSYAESASGDSDQPIPSTDPTDRQPDAFNVASTRQWQPQRNAGHLTQTVCVVLRTPNGCVKADGALEVSVSKVEPEAGDVRYISNSEANPFYSNQDPTGGCGVRLRSDGKRQEEKS